ncbi:MAG: hypothetical protein MZW92_20570 [Comamonadaceae bacterium]|nr:hypothetical protein [Comamonadaceae bacterium]
MHRRVRLRAPGVRPRRPSPRSAACRELQGRAHTWFCGAWTALRLPRGRPDVGARRRCGAARCAARWRAGRRRGRLTADAAADDGLPPAASRAARPSAQRCATARLRPGARTRFAYPHRTSCCCRCARCAPRPSARAARATAAAC